MKNWKYAFYRQKGINHGVCQDFVEVYADDSRIIACLCDGLGSLKNSDVAAQETVKNVIELFRSMSGAPTPKTDLKRFRQMLTEELQTRLKAAAAAHEMELDSMDCTLLFACLFLDRNMALVGCLGDSALCIIRDDKAPQLFCDSGFIGTRAVLDNDAAEHLQCDVFPLDGHVKSILLTSDGLENEIYYKGLTHVAKNTELYLNAMLRDDPQKIMQTRIEELTAAEDTSFDDDISIAVLSSLERPVRLADEPTWPCLCGAENLLVDTFCSECSRDFLDLYGHINFKGDRSGFFRYIRRDPAAKQALMTSIADGTPFRPPVSAKPQQRKPVTPPLQKPVTSESQAPEPDAPQEVPAENRVQEQASPHMEAGAAAAPQHAARHAQKSSFLTIGIVAAAVVVCAALLTALILVLIQNTQSPVDETVPITAIKTEPQEPTKHHEKKRKNNSEVNQAKPDTTTEQPPTEPEATMEPTLSGGVLPGRNGYGSSDSEQSEVDGNGNGYDGGNGNGYDGGNGYSYDGGNGYDP